MKTLKLFCFPAFFLLLFSNLTAQAPPFLRIFGQTPDYESGLGVYDAKDGNLLVTGVSGSDSLTIIKMTPQGDFIWARTINIKISLSGLYSREVISDLIVDMEGKIVCAGTIGHNRQGFILRYDPETDTILWIQEMILTAHVHGLVQSPLDSNYFVYVNSRDPFSTTAPGTQSMFTKINKQTGVFMLIPDSAIRFQTETDTAAHDLIRSLVVHEGKFYGCGDFTFPGMGSGGKRNNISRFDLNGNVEWSRMGPGGAELVQHFTGHDLFIEDQHIISTFSGNDTASTANTSAIFLQKTTLEGELVWLKKFDLGGIFNSETAEEVVSVPDGFVILGHQNIGQRSVFFLKTDKEGKLMWAKQLDFAETYLDDAGVPQSQLLYIYGGLYFTTATSPSPGQSDILVGRMSLDGQLGDNCDFLPALAVMESLVPDPKSIPIDLQKLDAGESVIKHYETFGPTTMTNFFLCSGVSVPCDTLFGQQTIPFCAGSGVSIGGQNYTQSATVIDTLSSSTGCDSIVTYTLVLLPVNTRNETIEFCPGSSVTINGQTFSQPGTVLDTIPGSAGCDTLVTYTIQFSTPVPSLLNIQCPGNISVIAEPGSAPMVITYNLPTAASDCPCGDINSALTNGLASGALFPNGISTVCYQANDACGQSAGCCFTVNIREQQACDEKVIGCIKYELLDISADAEHNLSYRIQVTNNCANKLIYTAIQVPNGLLALAPANNSVYTAPSGRNYDVRNPNASPMYSIRFKSISDSIANGQDDIFTYKLPAQTAPAFIHITSRLSPQLFYEAHLNTFNCPIQTEQTDKNAAPRENAGPLLKHLQLFPNPTQGYLSADVSDWDNVNLHITVFNNLGQPLWRQSLEAGAMHSGIQLPDALSDGFYFFELKSDNGEKQVVPFVLARR